MKQELKQCIDALYKCKIDIMRALMEGMPLENKTLSSIVKRSIFQGKKNYRFGNKKISLITPECIQSLKYVPEKCKEVFYDDVSISEYAVLGGDIVLVLEGAHAGTSAIMPVFSEGGLVDEYCAGISINSVIADPFYVVNVLHYWYRTGFFAEIMNSSGRISITELEGLEVPLPDIELQKKISMALLEISGVIERIKDL